MIEILAIILSGGIVFAVAFLVYLGNIRRVSATGFNATHAE